MEEVRRRGEEGCRVSETLYSGKREGAKSDVALRSSLDHDLTYWGALTLEGVRGVEDAVLYS